MKKNLLLSAVLLLLATRLFAATFMVNVGGIAFTPSTLTVHPGDIIMWMWTDGSHTTTSTSVPARATSSFTGLLGFPPSGTVYLYTPHPGVLGQVDY